MRLLRNKFIHRSISIFLLIVFVQPIFSPYYSFALTSGAHQPEFTSYEDGSSTDMVNLLTGDFTFNLPILDVPGPEGNFSLPLSYHAGISPEQESSWVGMGFNINAGSIVREINQYPDDAAGEPNYVTVQDLSGITGWNKIYNHPFKDDWNSQTGYHGNVNLLDVVEVDFGNQTAVGIVGVHVADGGVTFNPVEFTMAAMTILSFGIGGTASSAASVAKSVATNVAVNTAISFAMPVNTPGSLTSGQYSYSKQNLGTKFSFNDNARLSFLLGLPIHSRKKSWKLYLDATRTENMYGNLNLGRGSLGAWRGFVTINNLPTKDVYQVTSASDINFSLDNGSEYKNQHVTTALATDSYVVNASNVNGSISPYRLDVGSVAVPRFMDIIHEKYNILPFLTNYKVPFIYEGSYNNGYVNNAGGAGPPDASFYYGFTFPNFNINTFALNDISFEQRIAVPNDGIKKIPQGNNIEWLTNGDIRSSISSSSQTSPFGFIDFLSAADPNYPTINDFTNSDRYRFRSNFTTLGSNPFPVTYSTSSTNFNLQIPITDPTTLNQLIVGSTIKVTLWDVASSMNKEFSTTIATKTSTGITIPYDSNSSPFLNKSVTTSLVYSMMPASQNPQMQNGIGGYAITSANGVTYHFALPVYEYQRKSESILISDNAKRSIITRDPAFASTWLLTSITGPDFVDRNANGLVDDGDWGYWVKMNYGKHADAYNWRMPYATNNDTYMTDITGTYKSYEKGVKQLYYLNSIETRSHVALFMKSNREDGKSADGSSITPLRLDEICLLKKEHYKKLVSNYGISTYTDKISTLCMSAQFLPNGPTTAIRDYINKNCLKRVILNYDYILCKATPNAGGPTNPQNAKLTLIGFSVKGRNDIRTVPDYKFEYNNNPNYGVNNWDGWGMYSNAGTTVPASHKTSDPTGSQGAAWSLSKISTPLGSDILINYERDTYASISGESVLENSISYSNPNINYYYPVDLPIKKLFINHNNYFVVGDKVNISGDAYYKCPNNASYLSKSYSFNSCTVTGVGSNYITVAEDYMGLGTCGSTNSGTFINFQSQTGSVTKIVFNKTGGNIRVGSIVMRDEFGKENKLRYLYTNDDGSSSGVVAQEPEYIRTQSFPFYDQLKFPQTPVIYGKVSVLSGILSSDVDYYSKQVFEFETPHKSMLTNIAQDMGGRVITDPAFPGMSFGIEYRDFFKIEDRTSKIGALKSIKIFDKAGIVSESQMVYTDNLRNNESFNFQGIFSESTILADFSTPNYQTGFSALKRNRTTILAFPYVFKKIINLKDGFVSTSENLKWDLITGTVTETLSKSSLGIYVKTVSKPAYLQLPYAELGSKAYAISNRNMLLQNAATYVYRSDAIGSSLGLISGDAQTWSKVWANYRIYDGATSSYKDDPSAQTSPVWRKGAAYTWRGDYSKLQSTYGTQIFMPTDEFNFSGTNPSWQYLGEITRFDHYGMPLESVDLNQSNANASYTSVKMGYDNRTIIASAANAKYNEIAFSSAEDKIQGVPNIPYFGGEVGMGAGTVITTTLHTGNSALSVPSGGIGFFFNSTELSTTKRYRVSAWTNSPNGKIYYRANKTSSPIVPATQTISSPVAIPNMGNWYRIDLTFTPPTTTLEIGVRSASGTVVFDDFRFQPADAVMTCYVYPPPDYEFTIAAPAYSPAYAYSLDNDNLFTKHEVNEKGELVKVYAESLLYGVKLISESKSNLRRFNVNQ